MENNKQTAVEWLENQLKTRPKPLDNSQIDKLFEQAKEMEKQQIVESYRLGHIFHDSNDSDSPEEYYNTEYGTK